jgi:hypothetical protein
MNKLNSKWSGALAGVALSFSLFSANSAKAVTVTFSQGGWEYGGELSGSFTGNDLNSDGNINQSELSDFRAIFSGNLVRNTNDPITGEPIVSFFTLSFLQYEPNVLTNVFLFNYTSSTSQLSFLESKQTCLSILPIPRGICVSPQSNSSIFVNINLPFFNGLGAISFNPVPSEEDFVFTTTTSSAPTIGCSASNLQ